MLNETNEYQQEEEDKVEGPIWGVTEQLVDQAAGATGMKGRFRVFESTEQEGKVLQQWATSYIPYGI